MINKLIMASSLLYSDCYGDIYKYKKDEDIHLVKIIKSNNLKSKNKLEKIIILIYKK